MATAADPTPCSLPRAALQVHGHNCKAHLWALSRLPTPCQQSHPLFISATVFPATLHFKPVQLLAGNCLPLCLAEESNNYNINNPKENRRQTKQQSPKLWSLAFLHTPMVLQTALQKMVVLCASLRGVIHLFCSWSFSVWAGCRTFLTSHPHFTATESHSVPPGETCWAHPKHLLC